MIFSRKFTNHSFDPRRTWLKTSLSANGKSTSLKKAKIIERLKWDNEVLKFREQNPIPNSQNQTDWVNFTARETRIMAVLGKKRPFELSTSSSIPKGKKLHLQTKEIDSWTLVTLQSVCKILSLSGSGKKDALIARVKEHKVDLDESE